MTLRCAVSSSLSFLASAESALSLSVSICSRLDSKPVTWSCVISSFSSRSLRPMSLCATATAQRSHCDSGRRGMSGAYGSSAFSFAVLSSCSHAVRVSVSVATCIPSLGISRPANVMFGIRIGLPAFFLESSAIYSRRRRPLPEVGTTTVARRYASATCLSGWVKRE